MELPNISIQHTFIGNKPQIWVNISYSNILRINLLITAVSLNHHYWQIMFIFSIILNLYVQRLGWSLIFWFTTRVPATKTDTPFVTKNGSKRLMYKKKWARAVIGMTYKTITIGRQCDNDLCCFQWILLLCLAVQ